MKIETKPNIDWNAAPFSMENKISKQVRDTLCKRFDYAIANIRNASSYENLKLENGWVVKSSTDVSFILNSNKEEDLEKNTEVKGVFDSGDLGAKLRKLRDKAFDLEKFSELTEKVQGLTLDQATGKISIKLL